MLTGTFVNRFYTPFHHVSHHRCLPAVSVTHHHYCLHPTPHHVLPFYLYFTTPFPGLFRYHAPHHDRDFVFCSTTHLHSHAYDCRALFSRCSTTDVPHSAFDSPFCLVDHRCCLSAVHCCFRSVTSTVPATTLPAFILFMPSAHTLVSIFILTLLPLPPHLLNSAVARCVGCTRPPAPLPPPPHAVPLPPLLLRVHTCLRGSSSPPPPPARTVPFCCCCYLLHHFARTTPRLGALLARTFLPLYTLHLPAHFYVCGIMLTFSPYAHHTTYTYHVPYHTTTTHLPLPATGLVRFRQRTPGSALSFVPHHHLLPAHTRHILHTAGVDHHGFVLRTFFTPARHDTVLMLRSHKGCLRRLLPRSPARYCCHHIYTTGWDSVHS